MYIMNDIKYMLGFSLVLILIITFPAIILFLTNNLWYMIGAIIVDFIATYCLIVHELED